MLQDELAKSLKITKGYLSKLIKKGCPADDVGKARLWISANTKPRARRKTDKAPEPTTDIPPVCEVPTPVEYTPEARLGRAREMETAIFDACKLSIGRKEYGQLSNLLASYQKALGSITEAETQAQALRVQAGELIHRDTARAVLAELLVPLRNALDLLPLTERSRCNPADPKTAEDALRAWKDALLLRISQAETKF